MTVGTGRRSALVLVAHADDETLGAGGLIQRLAKGDWEVRTVILSDGIIAARGGDQDNKPDAIAACAVLGIEPPTFLGFPDQRFDQVAMADLSGAVAELGLEPDLVITHVETDLNLDHRLTAQAAKIVARPRRKPVSILGCEIPNTSFWNGVSFPANYFVDITQELDRKIEAFACYRGEIQPYPHPWSREGLRLLAQAHGMQCGVPFAEAFHLIRGYAGLLPDGAR
jgi:LmbE family N-acetylglucosaminyl deacetylase